ncbi:MAG: FAD-dependent oxidoreductase [Candidatus Hydrogenedentota bacterium]
MKFIVSLFVTAMVVISFSATAELRVGDAVYADVIIYGSTSAGVAAAIQVQRMGKTVILVGPDTHLGGLTAGGLGWTDSGKKEAVGGIAREYYQRLKAHYDRPEAWVHQKAEDYSRYRRNQDAMWVFEPRVAGQAFEELIREHEVRVRRDEWLQRNRGVTMKDGRITAIEMENGNKYTGRMFIDATYEGDLMASAGISYHVGREANAVYGETLNGVQTKRAISHQFDFKVDPYVVPGDASSGLLPKIHAGEPGVEGEGDDRIQAYCFRLCMTKVEENRVPFEKPEGYDAMDYEVLARYFAKGFTGVFKKFDPAPNAKTDTNNHGGFSSDNIGMNYGYPEASYAERAVIIEEHRRYQKGFLWFVANDPRVPDAIRNEMSAWGLAKDEFVDNNNWPHQIYVRESRRMVSDFVMTEPHLRGQKPVTRSIGMGSYNMDSHNVQRYVAHDADGTAYVMNEGDIQISPGRAYEIDYGAIVPKAEECENLLVPVCLSSSHIAYGSIRMEPVFMTLGQSAATAAVLAMEGRTSVQEVPYERLRKRMLKDKQVLELSSALD